MRRTLDATAARWHPLVAAGWGPLARLAVLAVLAVPAAFVASPAAAQRTLTIDRFEAEILVRGDGAIEVEERIVADFRGSWNGIFRDISLRHETAGGKRERLRLDLISVTDPGGTPLRHETSRKSWARRVKVWVPDANDAVRTVVIRYRVANALRFFDEDHPEGFQDELYWNVTGNEWEVPIRAASATVRLPPEVTGTAAWAYAGPRGSSAQDADVAVEGSTVSVQARPRLDPGAGLTVSVTWEPGVVQRPGAAEEAVRTVAGFWPLGLPVAVFLLMFGVWDRRGRDPETRPITVRYEPPEDLSPAEVGTLVDHKAEMHDITATLVDLAVRGYLDIEEVEEKKFFGLSTSTDYIFRLRKPWGEWGDLKPHERKYLTGLVGSGGGDSPVVNAGDLMRALFGDRERAGRLREAFGEERAASATLAAASIPELATVRLSELQNRFYKHLGGIRNALYDRLLEKGMYERRPDREKGIWTFAAFATLFIGGFWTIASLDGGLPGGAQPTAVAVGSVLSFAAVLVFGLLMPARTEKGARAMEAALGFKEFLARVEEDRYRRMITSPELFERYLPYAMAFKVEGKWAAAFESLYTTPPDWYHSSSGRAFRTTSFTKDLGRFASAAGSTMASSPSSSGSGGGGSSGGGSGGGGGGGF